MTAEQLVYRLVTVVLEDEDRVAAISDLEGYLYDAAHNAHMAALKCQVEVPELAQEFMGNSLELRQLAGYVGRVSDTYAA